MSYSVLLEKNSNYKNDKTNINEKFYSHLANESYIIYL